MLFQSQKSPLSIFLAFIAFSFLVVGGYFLLTTNSLEPLLSSETEPESVATPPEDTSAKNSTAGSNKSANKVLGTATTSISYDKLYSLINGYRREHKLSALRAHRVLEQSAALKISDMKQQNYWTHKDPQGRDSWYLLEQLGYHYEKAGENLSFGYTTEWRIFEEWTESPEHNAQLLTPDYEHMGMAADCSTYARGTEETCIVVLHLGKQLL